MPGEEFSETLSLAGFHVVGGGLDLESDRFSRINMTLTARLDKIRRKRLDKSLPPADGTYQSRSRYPSAMRICMDSLQC